MSKQTLNWSKLRMRERITRESKQKTRSQILADAQRKHLYVPLSAIAFEVMLDEVRKRPASELTDSDKQFLLGIPHAYHFHEGKLSEKQLRYLAGLAQMPNIEGVVQNARIRAKLI